MADNLADVTNLFERREDPRYVEGYSYFCKDCSLECNVGEASFDCQGGKIIPVYIKCRYGCGRAWHLEISSLGKVNIH